MVFILPHAQCATGTAQLVDSLQLPYTKGKSENLNNSRKTNQAWTPLPNLLLRGKAYILPMTSLLP